MKFHLNRFLRRVRIHGGEFDTSARAMYRDEVVYPLQAELRIVRRSTIERKQMSTKTTFKRIALVTVAALGFGVMSVVPSNAVINSDSLTLSAATASQTTAETATATSAVATLSFLAGVQNDSMSVTASLVSGPATSTALPYIQLTETASASIDTTTALIASSRAVGYAADPNVPSKAYNTTSGAAVVTAKYKVYLGTSITAAPSVVGTYVVKLTPAVTSSGGGSATAQTLTITVTAAAALDKVITSATSIITAGIVESGTVDAVVSASKTIGAGVTRASAKANIKITPKNAAGTVVGVTNADNAGESMTAVLTGPGSLGTGNWTTGPNTGRVINVKAGDFVYVYSDGAAGVTTITISSALGVVLATETMTFYGTATKAVSTVAKPVMGVAAGSGTAAIVVNIFDGTTEIKDATTFYVTSDKTTIISGAYTTTTELTYDADLGGFSINLTGLLAGTANITVGTKSSATATTGVEAAAVAVRVGSTTVADVKVAFDKASYLPGELATISVTPVDADGAILSSSDTYTVFAAGGIVAPVQLGTGSQTITAAAAHDAGVLGDGLGSDGVAKYTVYMPAYQGTFVFKYTTGTMATTALSAVDRTVSVDVISPDGGAAATAAEEAAAAAQDATDAALSAAEAAEAATAMAQEAVDAVAELSTQVAGLISELKAQITALTKLVVKIQKQVKA